MSTGLDISQFYLFLMVMVSLVSVAIGYLLGERKGKKRAAEVVDREFESKLKYLNGKLALAEDCYKRLVESAMESATSRTPPPAPEPLIFGTHHFVASEDLGDVEPWTVYPYAKSASGSWNGFSVARKECAVDLMHELDTYVVGHGR